MPDLAEPRVLDLLPDGLVVADAEGIVVEANAKRCDCSRSTRRSRLQPG